MEIQENKQTSLVTRDLKSRNHLGKITGCVNKDAFTNVLGNFYPKLFIKLEKIDVTEILEVRRKSKYPKEAQPDSFPNSENIVTSSNYNNNENICLRVSHNLHTMLIKQEKTSENITQTQNKTSSSDDTPKSDSITEPFNISSLSSTIELKQEKFRENTEKGLGTNTEIKISKTTQLHSSNESKVCKPGACSKRASQETTSEARYEANSNSSSETSKPSFDGATFLHTQMRTNIALQLILKDIVSLNEEYHCTNDHLLEVEIDKLRAKNKLPSLKTLDPFPNIEDSDSPEDSCESDDEIGNLGKDSGFDNESQESESNSEMTKNTIRLVKDDKTSQISVIYELNTEEDLEDSKGSEKLIIDELNAEQTSSENKDSESVIIDEPDDEAEDEPDYVDVEGIQLEDQKNKEVISLNGTRVEFDDDALECPFCATEFKTINSLKQHVQACLFSKLSGSILKSSDNETLNSVQNRRVENNSNKEAASSIKIGRVFSVGKETTECDTSSSNFVKEDGMDKHIKVHKRKKFRRTCKDCGITFCDEGFLEAHFKKTGHSQVYPLMPCNFCNFIAFNPSELDRHITFGHHIKRTKKQKTQDTPKTTSTEIIEIND